LYDHTRPLVSGVDVDGWDPCNSSLGWRARDVRGLRQLVYQRGGWGGIAED